MTSGMTGVSSDVPVLATHTHDKGMCMYACMTERLNGGNHSRPSARQLLKRTAELGQAISSLGTWRTTSALNPRTAQ